MSSSSFQTPGEVEPHPPKVPIPRLERRDCDLSRASTRRTRVQRACTGCRARKVKCTGEKPRCQNCATNDQPCSYDETRKDRLKTAHEQNSTLIAFLRSIKTRVLEEDNRRIEHLLRHMEHVSRPKLRKDSTKSSGTPDGERDDSSADETSGDDGLDGDGDLARMARPTSQDSGRRPRRDVKDELSQGASESVATSTPADNRETSTVQSRRDSERALRLAIGRAEPSEIIAYLQMQSEEDAQRALKHLRQGNHADLKSIRRWPRPHDGRSRSGSDKPSPNASTEPMSPTTKKVRVGQKLEETITAGTDVSSEPGAWIPVVTVAVSRRAVDTFVQSSGSLFHIIRDEDIQGLVGEMLQTLPPETAFWEVLKKCKALRSRARLAELCGIISVGLLYTRTIGERWRSSAEVGHRFYFVTKLLLDSAVEVNSARAMKVCAFLALYQLILAPEVALAYVEFGLGLGRLNQLAGRQCPPGIEYETFVDHQKTWKTLILLSSWLTASLGYQVSHALPIDLVDPIAIQCEMVKVTIIKADIMRLMADPSPDRDHGHTINSLREGLHRFNRELPAWMSLASLIDLPQTPSLRATIFYLHIFYLSAIQLLHRRAIASRAYLRSLPAHPLAKTAVSEGLVSAKMTARILALMMQEDAVLVRECYLCVYAAYTTAVVLLHKAAHKALAGYPGPSCATDLALVDTCLTFLTWCGSGADAGREDPLMVALAKRVRWFRELLRQAVEVPAGTNTGAGTDANANTNRQADVDMTEVDWAENDETDIVGHLLRVPEGSTPVHAAARDLLQLVHRPFAAAERELELLPAPAGAWGDVRLQDTLVNWMEAAAGCPLEWAWEMERAGLGKGDQNDDVDDDDRRCHRWLGSMLDEEMGVVACALDGVDGV